MYLTVAWAALVASGKVWLGGPPCMLTQPIVTGDPLAVPAGPPTYCWKAVATPRPPGRGAAAAEPVLAGARAGAQRAGLVRGGVELVLPLELQAAPPAPRQAPAAA